MSTGTATVKAAPAPPAPEPWREVQQIVEAAVINAGSSFHSSILAGQILTDIKQNRPRLWDAWSAQVAMDQIKIVIGRNRQSHRRVSSPLARKGYSLTEEVDSTHTIRQIGDCVKSDLDYIARSYSKRAASNSLKAKRFRALRDKMPNDVALVRDVVSEADIEAIYA